MPTIQDFELVNHGYEHEQYFQGCGVAFTKFDVCYTGIGDTPAEAAEDAREQSIVNGDHWSSDLQDTFRVEVSDALPVMPDTERNEDCHYYVSIRVQYAQS